MKEPIKIRWQTETSSDHKYVFCSIFIETSQGRIGYDTWCVGLSLVDSISELVKILRDQKETGVPGSIFEEYTHANVFASLRQYLKTRNPQDLCFYGRLQNADKIGSAYKPYQAVPYGVENFDGLQSFIVRLDDDTACLMWQNSDHPLRYMMVNYSDYLSMWETCYSAVRSEIAGVMILADEYNTFYASHFGTIELSSPVFYKFPVSIRFETGIKGPEHAVHRAAAVFSELFHNGDPVYIVVNSFEDDPKDAANHDISVIRSLLLEVTHSYSYITSAEDFLCKRYVMKAIVRPDDFLKLIEKIVWSDFEDRNDLQSGVFLVNGRTGVLYHLYDSRGLDVAADDKEKLRSVYHKFNDWILAYDREVIDKTFEGRT